MAEKEYIERNDLIKNLNTFAPECYNALINNLIMKQPAADVVEVIRCKDCIYRDFLDSDYGGYCCEINRIEIHLDDYCCFGERKELDNEQN